MNYYDSDVDAEALKLCFYMPQTFLDDTTNPSPMFYGFYTLMTTGIRNSLTNTNSQKQPSEVFCKTRCSEKFHKIHRKTPVPESLF